MSSDENRTILVAVVATIVVSAVLLTAEVLAEPFTGWRVLVGFLVFGVLAVAAPQLYLARTDSSVPASTRIWATVAILVFFAVSFSPDAAAGERIVIWAITAGVFLLAMPHEIRAGYRSSTETDENSTVSQ